MPYRVRAEIARSSFYVSYLTDRGWLGRGFGTLYISALPAVSVLSLLLANYLAHHPELRDDQATAESREHVIGSVFSVVALAIALIISLFAPAAGMWALLLLFPAQIIAGRVSNSNSARS